MSTQQKQRVLQMIEEKRYSEAKIMLEMIDDPKAQKWKAELGQILSLASDGVHINTPPASGIRQRALGCVLFAIALWLGLIAIGAGLNLVLDIFGVRDGPGSYVFTDLVCFATTLPVGYLAFIAAQQRLASRPGKKKTIVI